MLTPIPWESIPDGARVLVWKGDGGAVADAPAIFFPESGVSMFLMELSDNDRRQLIEGNPLYFAVAGHVRPFMLTANLGEALDAVRSA